MTQYPFLQSFDLALLKQLLHDPALVVHLASYLKPEKIQTENVRTLVGWILAHFILHYRVPTGIALLQTARMESERGRITFEKICELAQTIEDAEECEGVDSDYLKTVVLGEERKAAVWGALEHGLKSYKNGDYDSIEDAVVKANMIGKDGSSPGTDFVETLAFRTESRLRGDVPFRWGTGIQDLDDALHGGLAAGELGCILAAPKQGKSLALNYIALSIVEHGGNVYYYTLEMSERDVVDRMDAAISNTMTVDIKSRATIVQELVTAWMKRVGGSLYIKKFLPGVTTVAMLDADIRQRSLMKKSNPTAVIVDYGDLLTINRVEKRYDELGIVYTDLKRLAITWSVPVWTASQTNRSALDKNIVTMGDTGEGFKKVAICDVQIALCATESEIQSNLIRLYIAAARFTQMGIVLGPYRTGSAEGRFIVGTTKYIDDDE
jgi:hypothetical protein